jgi:hypothetical protein
VTFSEGPSWCIIVIELTAKPASNLYQLHNMQNESMVFMFIVLSESSYMVNEAKPFSAFPKRCNTMKKSISYKISLLLNYVLNFS